MALYSIVVPRIYVNIGFTRKERKIMLVQLLLVSGLMVVHIFAGKLRFLDGIPRSSWLSFAGGISVAYVFLHIFPEMGEAQESINPDIAVGLSCKT